MLYCPLANQLRKVGAGWMIDCVCVHTHSLPAQHHPTENHLQIDGFPPHLSLSEDQLFAASSSRAADGTKACRFRFPIASSVTVN